ncbi:MAG: ornithine cyclodeaminase [Candidatus Freyarchaeota archaeon]|nr:TIGR00300 family protein [Candidatus Freyrarchaeum guaymaensis]
MKEAEVELKGHIIDSFILPKVFATIYDLEGEFEVLEFNIGRTKTEHSYAKLLIMGKNEKHLRMILAELQKLGANVLERVKSVKLAPAPADGVLPDNFYSTTNHPTYILLDEEWVKCENIEMDKVIVVRDGKPVCVPMRKVRKGDLVVLNDSGIKVVPPERSRKKEIFGFMTSEVSPEKPTSALIRKIAEEMWRIKREKGKIVVVAGPAVVHSGAADALAALIRKRYVNALLSGNALAVHDIENSLYGTSLGMNLKTLENYEGGHRHHLMAINEVRKRGSIRNAVKTGVLRRGIMYECIINNVPFVLAGSIRDDGPLPEVITDVLEAQDAMREQLKNARLVLMLASMLHSIAAGNMLPSTVKIVCVDINPAAVMKLTDRGTYALGVISDVGAFLPQLVQEIERVEANVE